MQWDKSERNTSEKSTFQTSPNWRANLPRLEGVLFQGLGPWRIIFFHFRNHFLKIHAQQIPKISHFKFSTIFGWENGCQIKKSAFWPLRSPNPLPAASGLGNQTNCGWPIAIPTKTNHKTFKIYRLNNTYLNPCSFLECLCGGSDFSEQEQSLHKTKELLLLFLDKMYLPYLFLPHVSHSYEICQKFYTTGYSG